MLVLTRRRQERVYITGPGGEILIYVVDIKGKQVRLGFEAPAKFTIHRKEVVDRIKAKAERAG